MRLKIAGGRVYDPATNCQGEVRDLYIENGRIVPYLPEVDRVIGVQGRMVAPAGIDIRGQVATYGLNFLRLDGSFPSPYALGASYAALGYTHVHEPFLTTQTASYVHRQLAAMPVVDASTSLVVNLRELDLWLPAGDRQGEILETLRFLLEQTRSLNLRLAEPYVRYRRDFYAHRSLDLDRVLGILTPLVESSGLTFTLEASPQLLRASFPSPPAFHLAALGPALTSDETLDAALTILSAGTTADMGLMLADGSPSPVGRSRRIDLGWFQPLDLAPAADPAVARRALALALTYRGPNLAFSGAGPVQAPVADYPRLFSWLVDSSFRPQDWGSDLTERRYSLAEWLWATRTLPARLLGLADRGHLGPGARADVAIYDLPEDAAAGRRPQCPNHCRTLLKAGEVVVEDFSLVYPEVSRATFFRRTDAPATSLVQEICQLHSLRWENAWVQDRLGGPWTGI